jgi:hypothetical protein
MFPQGLYNMLGMPDLMEAFYNRAVWQLKFVYWPRRCNLSQRWIWPFSHAYKGTVIWTGPGTPAVEVQWHDGVEHLVWLLKGNSK